MSVFRSRPALRWLVPTAAAVAVIGGGAAAGTIVASAGSPLPDRSAAQLLVDVQNAKVAGLSGTIVENADLGVPVLSGVQGSGKADISSLIAGSNTAKVWYAGEDRARLALLGTQGETDVIRNGSDVWMWSSTEKTATHLKIPADAAARHPESLSQVVPTTPQEAADAALAAITPTTTVTTTGAAKVAGRDAYELVLAPKDTASLVGQVRLAIDAEQHIPLRVDVYAKNATNPAFRVAFHQISFAVPDAAQFAFNPAPGTKVTESALGATKGDAKESPAAQLKAAQKAEAGLSPKVIGTGWTSVVELKLPKSDGKGKDGKNGAAADPLSGSNGVLTEVSGAWGKGRLFSGSLFSVLLTDDGRVLAGAVAPAKLYEAATK